MGCVGLRDQHPLPAMKTVHGFGTGLALIYVLGLVGCSKSEPVATTPPPAPAPAAATTVTSAPVAVSTEAVAAAKESAATTTASLAVAARESLANFKLPDFQAASTQQLSGLAAQALTQWAQAIEKPSPAVTAEVESVKTALAQEKPAAALASLTKLGDYAKAIPGGEALLQSSKQLVGAWALKQGFDVAKISGVLGALQRGDYAGLASQAATLLAKGGVSTEQKGLLDGVLGTFGIDATQASGAVNAVKGLFAK
jgi:hypothetical protein